MLTLHHTTFLSNVVILYFTTHGQYLMPWSYLYYVVLQSNVYTYLLERNSLYFVHYQVLFPSLSYAVFNIFIYERYCTLVQYFYKGCNNQNRNWLLVG